MHPKDGDLDSAPGQPLLPNGAAIAACLSAPVGFLAMAIATIASHATDQARDALMAFGSVIPIIGPGANGPYAGHQAVFLLGWLGSWLLLHLLLRRKDFSGPGWLVLALGGVGLSTLLLWPPFYKLITGKY
jgi:hypothetical protein